MNRRKKEASHIVIIPATANQVESHSTSSLIPLLGGNGTGKKWKYFIPAVSLICCFGFIKITSYRKSRRAKIFPRDQRKSENFSPAIFPGGWGGVIFLLAQIYNISFRQTGLRPSDPATGFRLESSKRERWEKFFPSRWNRKSGKEGRCSEQWWVVTHLNGVLILEEAEEANVCI